MQDHVSVLNIDHPGDDGFYGLYELTISGTYASPTGGKDIDVLGVDIEAFGDGALRFLMINHRPYADESGNYLDATKIGANSTVEIFDLRKGSSELEHVKTIWDKAIATPNNLAATGDGGFVFTNDHDLWKVGTVSQI